MIISVSNVIGYSPLGVKPAQRLKRSLLPDETRDCIESMPEPVRYGLVKHRCDVVASLAGFCILPGAVACYTIT